MKNYVKLTKNYIDKLDRLSWDDYFLNIAVMVSLRSDDKFIKHGAVLVDNDTKHIIATGYNNTFRNCDLNIVEPDNRDKRRKWMIHAEENMITNATKNPLNIQNGATAYITGLPCVNCLQRMINFGIKKIVYKERNGTVTENEETREMREDILNMNIGVELIGIKNTQIF